MSHVMLLELVLRQEQEEYKREGIEWTNIEYFNNKVRPLDYFLFADNLSLMKNAFFPSTIQIDYLRIGRTTAQRYHIHNGRGLLNRWKNHRRNTFRSDGQKLGQSCALQ